MRISRDAERTEKAVECTVPSIQADFVHPAAATAAGDKNLGGAKALRTHVLATSRMCTRLAFEVCIACGQPTLERTLRFAAWHTR
jgi:hypothetical protein